MAAVAAPVTVAVISEAGDALPAVAEDMVDMEGTRVMEGTQVMEGTVAIAVGTEGEEATDITAVTAVGDGAALVLDSDSTTRLCRSITQRFGARTDRLITTLMTTIINGKQLQTNMRP